MRQAHGARPCAAVFFHPDFPGSSRFPTVGSGIGPDLLTFPIESTWKRSRARANHAVTARSHLPPVGSLTPPWRRYVLWLPANRPADS